MAGVEAAMTVPESFQPYARTSRYLDLIGPLLQHRDDPSTVGLLTDDRHTNSRGIVHGGLLVAIADTVMGHAAERAGQGRRVVTASLTTDFTGAAQGGRWVQGTATVQRAGRRLAFASCAFHCGDQLILSATGVFAVTDSSGS
jgi:acyl-coenzyme A thioesterase 13